MNNQQISKILEGMEARLKSLVITANNQTEAIKRLSEEFNSSLKNSQARKGQGTELENDSSSPDLNSTNYEELNNIIEEFRKKWEIKGANIWWEEPFKRCFDAGIKQGKQENKSKGCEHNVRIGITSNDDVRCLKCGEDCRKQENKSKGCSKFFNSSTGERMCGAYYYDLKQIALCDKCLKQDFSVIDKKSEQKEIKNVK